MLKILDLQIVTIRMLGDALSEHLKRIVFSGLLYYFGRATKIILQKALHQSCYFRDAKGLALIRLCVLNGYIARSTKARNCIYSAKIMIFCDGNFSQK